MGVFKRYKDAQAAQKNAENAMPGAYQSNYTDRINEALDSMGAASNAGYDVGTDSELYRQYRAGAQANARAAAENAAAGAAALSGGYGSSYANSVAQQGYQQAMANVDSGLAGLRDKALTLYQLKQNGLSGLLSALQNQDSLEAAEHQGAVANAQDWRDYKKSRADQAAQEKNDFLSNLWEMAKSVGRAGLTAYDTYKGYTQQQWEERVCPGTVGVQQRAHRPERCTECLRAGVQPVPAGSGRCRERRAGPVWSGYRNLRQLQRRTHHPRRQGGCAHDRSRAGRRRQRRGCTGGAGTVRPGSELCGELQDDCRTAACNGAGNKERRKLGQLFGQKEQQNEKQREKPDLCPAAEYVEGVCHNESE